ncbi:MAG TPA: hypothetical protein PLA83_03820 [Deltaproteobacteria bacterium]|nr:hypothetical protein [Deltaproteobacteria bacterium]
MKRRPINYSEFLIEPHTILARQWLVLTCGDFEAGKFNAMTIGWGSFGVMWNMPLPRSWSGPGGTPSSS